MITLIKEVKTNEWRDGGKHLTTLAREKNMSMMNSVPFVLVASGPVLGCYILEKSKQSSRLAVWL